MAWVWFGLAAIGWVAFGGFLVVAAGTLDQAWTWVGGQPLVAKLGLWLLLLPWMAALAIWQTSWELWLRLLLVLGIAWANLYMFFPKAT